MKRRWFAWIGGRLPATPHIPQCHKPQMGRRGGGAVHLELEDGADETTADRSTCFAPNDQYSDTEKKAIRVTYPRQSQGRPRQNVPSYSSTGCTCPLSSQPCRFHGALEELVRSYRVRIAADSPLAGVGAGGHGGRSAAGLRGTMNSSWQVLVERGGRVSRHNWMGRDPCGR